MTGEVTLPGGSDRYMLFGDVYAKHNDGTLDVFRVGAEEAYSYACGEWTDVEGDRKRLHAGFLGLIRAARRSARRLTCGWRVDWLVSRSFGRCHRRHFCVDEQLSSRTPLARQTNVWAETEPI
jgi:hypothetical protein